MQPASLPLARSPLHSWQAARGARFETHQGAQVVAAYSEVEQELAATHAGLGLADISLLAKIALRGKGIPALARHLLGDSPPSQPRGVAALPGSGLDLACRLTEDHLLLLADASEARAMEEQMATLAPELGFLVVDVTAAYAGFELMGPHVDEVLRRLTALDVSRAALPPGACAETSLAGVHGLLVRPPRTSLPSVRLYLTSDLGEYVWETLLDAGRDWGIVPVGFHAWQRFQSG